MATDHHRLLSVMVDDAARAVVAQAYGALYSYWIGYSVPAQFSRTVPSGIVAPGSRRLARYPGDGRPALAITDIDLNWTDPDIDVAVRLACQFSCELASARPIGLRLATSPVLSISHLVSTLLRIWGSSAAGPPGAVQSPDRLTTRTALAMPGARSPCPARPDNDGHNEAPHLPHLPRRCRVPAFQSRGLSATRSPKPAG